MPLYRADLISLRQRGWWIQGEGAPTRPTGSSVRRQRPSWRTKTCASVTVSSATTRAPAKSPSTCPSWYCPTSFINSCRRGTPRVYSGDLFTHSFTHSVNCLSQLVFLVYGFWLFNALRTSVSWFLCCLTIGNQTHLATGIQSMPLQREIKIMVSSNTTRGEWPGYNFRLILRCFVKCSQGWGVMSFSSKL